MCFLHTQGSPIQHRREESATGWSCQAAWGRQGLLGTWCSIRKTQALHWSTVPPSSPPPCVCPCSFHHGQGLQRIEDRSSWSVLSLAPLKCHPQIQAKRSCSAVAQGTLPALHRKPFSGPGSSPEPPLRYYTSPTQTYHKSTRLLSYSRSSDL